MPKIFEYLDSFPQYNKYLDPDIFRTFVVDDGNVVWGEDWDLIFPVENLYIGRVA